MKRYFEFTPELKNRIDESIIKKKNLKFRSSTHAKLLGVHRSTLSHFENFNQLMKTDKIHLYFKILDEVVQGKRDPKSGESYFKETMEDKKWLCYHIVNEKLNYPINLETAYTKIHAKTHDEALKKYCKVLANNTYFRKYITESTLFSQQFKKDDKGFLHKDVTTNVIDDGKCRRDILEKHLKEINDYITKWTFKNLEEYFKAAPEFIHLAQKHINGEKIDLPEEFYLHCAEAEQEYAKITIVEW